MYFHIIINYTYVVQFWEDTENTQLKKGRKSDGRFWNSCIDYVSTLPIYTSKVSTPMAVKFIIL